MPRVSEGCLPSDYMDYMKGSNSNLQDSTTIVETKKEVVNSKFTKFRPNELRDPDLNVSSPGMLEKGNSDKTE